MNINHAAVPFSLNYFDTALQVNHRLPDKIIVFRDGVGDGQLNTVAGYEVDQLKKCFGHFGEEYTPDLAVVIVQKRINTRIFLKVL